MKFDKVTLRCDDGAEAAVFTRYIHDKVIMKLPDSVIDFDDSYEICIEDDYTGGDYKGFFGRLKRTWRAFTNKPVVYTGIYTEDKDKMRKFLCDCLDLMDENDVKDIKTMYDELNGNSQYKRDI